MKTETNKQFIVVYDDDQGPCVPMARDAECSGAICGFCGDDKIALFPSRAAARKAIDISAKWAALQKAQGNPANEDFLSGRANLKIKECSTK